MTHKFVVRFLDDADALVGWAEVQAEARPQAPRGASCPFWPVAEGPTSFVAERAATVTKFSVHWCELDVARVRDMPPCALEAGQVGLFVWFEPVWLVSGMRDVPLPTVTVRGPVTLQPLMGELGTRVGSQ